jgi:hypothetical protein
MMTEARGQRSENRGQKTEVGMWNAECGMRNYGTVEGLRKKMNIDGIVKSRFKDWIPAFAGMTPVISI